MSTPSVAAIASMFLMHDAVSTCGDSYVSVSVHDAQKWPADARAVDQRIGKTPPSACVFPLHSRLKHCLWLGVLQVERGFAVLHCEALETRRICMWLLGIAKLFWMVAHLQCDDDVVVRGARVPVDTRQGVSATALPCSKDWSPRRGRAKSGDYYYRMTAAAAAAADCTHPRRPASFMHRCGK